MRWSPSDCKELHWNYVKSITLKESIQCWSESLCNGKYKQVQIKVLTFQVHCNVYSGWWVQESVGWQVAGRENPRRWNCLLLDKQGWPRFWSLDKHQTLKWTFVNGLLVVSSPPFQWLWYKQGDSSSRETDAKKTLIEVRIILVNNTGWNFESENIEKCLLVKCWGNVAAEHGTRPRAVKP